MRIRTRRTDQRVKPSELGIRPVVTRPTGYIEWSDDLPLVHSDGALIVSAWATLKGQYLMSIELDDQDLAELVAARLRVRPAETIAAIGRAMGEIGENLGSAKPSDALASMGIDTSRQRDFPF